MGFPTHDPPQAGDIVLLLKVEVAGPKPDVSLDPRLSLFIAIRDRWNVDDVLAMIEGRVERILGLF